MKQRTSGTGIIMTAVKRLEETGRYTTFVGNTLRYTVRRPFRIGLVFEQMERIGVDSVPIIALSSLAIGMIFSLQMIDLLQPFRAEIATGSAVAVTLARELAPVITTLMLIAKSGSAMAAELGTMQVTEQIDALQTMTVNPVDYLVVPRVWASVFMFPALTLLANVVGVIGSYVVATGVYELQGPVYIDRMFADLRPVDIAAGLIKAAVMGFIVATICTYDGLKSSGGAKGVGESSTRAVVTASVSILVADYILASLLMKVMG
ncbi:MAG: MlaE family ABC transporter permease [Spirochaetota bacterium]